MSLGEEFQVTLASNVTSNKKNKPSAFETTLAKPLDLAGDWEVALIDLTYPHNWTNLDKETSGCILTKPYTDEGKHVSVLTNKKEQERINEMKEQLDNEMAAIEFVIPAGNYKVEDIVSFLTTQINKIPTLKDNKITFNENTHKVTCTQTVGYSIAVFPEDSILQLLGFSKQTTLHELPSKYHLEMLELEPNKSKTSQLTADIKRLSSIFVYSDIVERSLVGDSQSTLLGYCPIHSKFGDQGYWNFNPPYYVRVREKYITTIKIELCTDTGDTIPIEEGKVFCRLNFRKVGWIR